MEGTFCGAAQGRLIVFVVLDIPGIPWQQPLLLLLLLLLLLGVQLAAGQVLQGYLQWVGHT
jgi:hypothetical protein